MSGLQDAVDGLFARYATAMDDNRLEDWLELFAEDCRYPPNSMTTATVVSEVVGRVVRVSPKFEPGGSMEANEVFIQVDPEE